MPSIGSHCGTISSAMRMEWPIRARPGNGSPIGSCRRLETNMPYDRMVQSLLNPEGKEAPRGFLAGINWGGDVSASQSVPMQAAQNSAQVFLGANLKCASCHDSFVSRWKLADVFSLAAFFSDKPLELARCEVKTGKTATASFLFPELEKEEMSLSARARAAALFTSGKNGRFARTIVNRYWRVSYGSRTRRARR